MTSPPLLEVVDAGNLAVDHLELRGLLFTFTEPKRWPDPIRSP
jgi:hypothetical protein